MSIDLQFFGAARNVTGSCFLLRTGGVQLLVDCGMYQERELRSRNWDTFPVDPGSIDAVILTHGHLDHCGRLPKLVHEGFNGPIYATQPTLEIARIVLADAAHLLAEDMAFKAKRLEREGREPSHPLTPLYSERDVRYTTPLFSAVKYGEPVPVADGIEATFNQAGHILGSAAVRLQIENSTTRRSIVFSGDVGRWDRPIICDPELFTNTDYVVMESTYGDREHEPSDELRATMAQIINETVDRGGNILIPAFAIERTQEVLYQLHSLLTEKRIPPLMVFLDSPMAVKVTRVFKRHRELFDQEMQSLVENASSPFSFRGLKPVRTQRESKGINRIHGSVIIIAGSGMCTGGRIKHHLVHNIEREQATVMFVGYQASGTLGRELINGAETVRILGEQRQVRARIAQLNGFSSHADKHELLRWLRGFTGPLEHVYAIHGGARVTQRFADFVAAETGWPTSAPEYEETVTLP